LGASERRDMSLMCRQEMPRTGMQNVVVERLLIALDREV
jgi:hypothetical protein